MSKKVYMLTDGADGYNRTTFFGSRDRAEARAFEIAAEAGIKLADPPIWKNAGSSLADEMGGLTGITIDWRTVH